MMKGLRFTAVCALVAAAGFLAVGCGAGGNSNGDDPDPPGRGVNVNPNTAQVARGATVQFSAEVTPPEAAADGILWTATPGAMGSISPDGLLTVAANATVGGIVTVQASVPGVGTGSATVTVFEAPTGVVIDQTVPVVDRNSSTRLTATVNPSAASQEVVWSIEGEPPSGITIEPNGLVRASLMAVEDDVFYVRATVSGHTDLYARVLVTVI